ncbi:CDP-diacylglycerol--serine O-phosphatidyltransferase [Roseimaritima sediminicola]|uniref:CDP-diacylglycerol--serine O-phosphatidyltransferase n=1 Tax=Roseimaritima sediminicola TaxID=2662066 RepID=UPI001EEE0E9C|nr:CDP-diacylglycerol--serine O-phosphatidyltransferase [Roseimaritima sediminicola]
MSELRRRIWPRHRGPRRRRRLTLAVLPTMLTLGNGVCGMASIAVAVSVNLPWEDDQKLFIAGCLIFIGMLFDALDGSAARMTNQSSQFGAELDSLCDAITFGAAPAVILWRFSDVFPHRLSWAIGVVFTLCVLIRLARFNVETEEDDPHEGFEGLPSPAAAGTIASFVISVPHLHSLTTNGYGERIQDLANTALTVFQYAVPLMTLTLAYLMVSRFRYPHVVQQWLRGRKAPHQIGQALFVIGGVFLFNELALPLALCFYAFSGPVRHLAVRLGVTKADASSPTLVTDPEPPPTES